MSKFYNTRSGDVADLVTAIYEKGPISVAIDASHKSFSFYSHGIYYEQDCGEHVIMHACMHTYSGVGMLYYSPLQVMVLMIWIIKCWL